MVKNLETFTNHNHVNVERNAFNDNDKDYYKDGEDQPHFLTFKVFSDI